MWKSLQFYVDKRGKLCYTIIVLWKKQEIRYTYFEDTLDKF